MGRLIKHLVGWMVGWMVVCFLLALPFCLVFALLPLSIERKLYFSVFAPEAPTGTYSPIYVSQVQADEGSTKFGITLTGRGDQLDRLDEDLAGLQESSGMEYEAECSESFTNHCVPLSPQTIYYARWATPKHEQLAIAQSSPETDRKTWLATVQLYDVVQHEETRPERPPELSINQFLICQGNLDDSGKCTKIQYAPVSGAMWYSGAGVGTRLTFQCIYNHKVVQESEPFLLQNAQGGYRYTCDNAWRHSPAFGEHKLSIIDESSRVLGSTTTLAISRSEVNSPEWTEDIEQVLPEQKHISAEAAARLLLHKVTPRYPPLARYAHVEGEVTMNVIIGENGEVSNIKVVSGDPLLWEAAIDAVRQWQYRPTKFMGEALDVGTTITVPFKLESARASAAR